MAGTEHEKNVGAKAAATSASKAGYELGACRPRQKKLSPKRPTKLPKAATRKTNGCGIDRAA